MTAPKYASIWRVEPGTLPVMPVFYVTNPPAHGNLLHTAFRGPRDGSLWAGGGVNLQPVPEFCGGFYATAFNVHASTFNARYAREGQAESFEAMPSVSDFFTPEQWAEAVTRYNALPPVGVNGFDFGNEYSATMRMCVVSVMTQLMVIQGAWNRASCSFWDTRTGATRLLFKWARTVLQGGVVAPKSLPDVHFIERHNLYDGGRLGDTLYDTQTLPSRVYPTRFITGMFLRNPNSGNGVAQSTFYATTLRGPNDLGLPPAVRLVRAQTSREMLLDFLGPQRKANFGAVPERYHPM
jgi:hypothetical protein